MSHIVTPDCTKGPFTDPVCRSRPALLRLRWKSLLLKRSCDYYKVQEEASNLTLPTSDTLHASREQLGPGRVVAV
ncbi:hypothetical protein PAMP_018381 [Pampus punctatissimus]